MLLSPPSFCFCSCLRPLLPRVLPAPSRLGLTSPVLVVLVVLVVACSSGPRPSSTAPSCGPPRPSLLLHNRLFQGATRTRTTRTIVEIKWSGTDSGWQGMPEGTSKKGTSPRSCPVDPGTSSLIKSSRSPAAARRLLQPFTHHSFRLQAVLQPRSRHYLVDLNLPGLGTGPQLRICIFDLSAPLLLAILFDSSAANRPTNCTRLASSAAQKTAASDRLPSVVRARLCHSC